MGLISFLFGKAPEITFTREGRTVHELDPKKWEAWNDRFRKNPNYDFKQHSGTKGVIDMSTPAQSAKVAASAAGKLNDPTKK